MSTAPAHGPMRSRADPPVAVVLSAGPLTTVQDLGRFGLAHLGVPRSGPGDRGAAALANRLVGNPPQAALLEVTAGGLQLRLPDTRRVAVTGAQTEVRLGGRALASHTLGYSTPGAVLTVGRPARGVRSYVAISGGLDVEPVLGSRSTDVLSGLGPAPLREGDLLPLGRSAPFIPVVGWAPPPAVPEVIWLRLRWGPRADWFTPQSVQAFTGGSYEVSPLSNRIAVRLRGPALARRPEFGELASEGMATGAVEVPADGQPLVFLADHPTTGGYPVIGVVHPDDLDLLAQAAPGIRLRFQPVR
jgi:biotin-dependent carboxylase-like uncharacterized protein